MYMCMLYTIRNFFFVLKEERVLRVLDDRGLRRILKYEGQ